MSFVLHPRMYINSTHIFSTGDVGSTEGFLSGGTQLSLPEEPSCHAQEERKEADSKFSTSGPSQPDDILLSVGESKCNSAAMPAESK